MLILLVVGSIYQSSRVNGLSQTWQDSWTGTPINSLSLPPSSPILFTCYQISIRSQIWRKSMWLILNLSSQIPPSPILMSTLRRNLMVHHLLLWLCISYQSITLKSSTQGRCLSRLRVQLIRHLSYTRYSLTLAVCSSTSMTLSSTDAIALHTN
jgi:hypothetical protein